MWSWLMLRQSPCTVISLLSIDFIPPSPSIHFHDTFAYFLLLFSLLYNVCCCYYHTYRIFVSLLCAFVSFADGQLAFASVEPEYVTLLKYFILHFVAQCFACRFEPCQNAEVPLRYERNRKQIDGVFTLQIQMLSSLPFQTISLFLKSA